MRLKIFLAVLLLLLNKSIPAQNDTDVVNRLNKQAWEKKNSNLDSAILLANHSIVLLNAMKGEQNFPPQWQERARAKTLYYLGSFFNQKGEDSIAFNHFRKSLILSEEIKDMRGISSAMGGLGLIYSGQSDFPKALEYYFMALKIDEKIGNKEGILSRLGNIGVVYDNQKNYHKALEYYTKALKIAEGLKKKNSISIQYCNIGVVYSELMDLNRALGFFEKALAMDLERGNKNGIARNLNNIASIYKDQKNYAKALEYFSQALKVAEEQGNMDNISSMTGNVGIMYTLLKDYKKSEDFLLKAIKISEEIKSLAAVSEFEGALSDLYSRWGKEGQALAHYKKHILLKDSIYNAENTERNLREELNYEYDKKQVIDDALHEKQVFLLEAENKTQKQLRLFLFVIIGMILLTLYFMKRAYDNKKQIAGLLVAESDRKEILLQEVHHRINNNLQTISSLLTLQANSSHDAKLQEYLQQSLHRIQSLSALHDLLYQHEPSLEINIREYLDKVLDFHREVLQGKPFKAEIILDAVDAQFPTQTAVMLALIVNELVTNSIKYAFNSGDNGKIEINLIPDKDKIDYFALRVSDNGKGLPPDDEYRKESLGFRLINMMTKQMKASLIKINSPASFVLLFTIKPDKN